MKYVILFYAFVLTAVCLPAIAKANDSTVVKPEIDPSKPTNLYTQANANLEYQKRTGVDVYGIRLNINYAFNPNNITIVEVPFLFNSANNKFGIADTRIRYFSVFKRNISKRFIALGAFADITAPTGNYDNGFGTSSWSVGVGLISGFTFCKYFSFFPGVSYIHVTKPKADSIPDQFRKISDGIGLQFNASIRLTKSMFVFVNPVPSFLYSDGDWNITWLAEFSLNYIIKPNKFKMNLNYNPNFSTGNFVMRMGGTLFF